MQLARRSAYQWVAPCRGRCPVALLEAVVANCAIRRQARVMGPRQVHIVAVLLGRDGERRAVVALATFSCGPDTCPGETVYVCSRIPLVATSPESCWGPIDDARRTAERASQSADRPLYPSVRR
jgi:hypothetical protein